MDYKSGLKAQNEARQYVLADAKKKEIIGLEHPPTITVGKRLLNKNKSVEVSIGASADQFENFQKMASGFTVFPTERGGQITLHSPGQLVIYPILNLDHLNMSVRKYVELLIQTSQDTLSALNIKTFEKNQSPGLYTNSGKIAFFGIRVQKKITSHGLAINITNDLNLFKRIVSCGVQNESFDRLAEYLPTTSCEEVFKLWTEVFNSKIK